MKFRLEALLRAPMVVRVVVLGYVAAFRGATLRETQDLIDGKWLPPSGLVVYGDKCALVVTEMDAELWAYLDPDAPKGSREQLMEALREAGRVAEQHITPRFAGTSG